MTDHVDRATDNTVEQEHRRIGLWHGAPDLSKVWLRGALDELDAVEELTDTVTTIATRRAST